MHRRGGSHRRRLVNLVAADLGENSRPAQHLCFTPIASVLIAEHAAADAARADASPAAAKQTADHGSTPNRADPPEGFGWVCTDFANKHQNSNRLRDFRWNRAERASAAADEPDTPSQENDEKRLRVDDRLMRPAFESATESACDHCS